MTWTNKYWDIINQLFWSPKYMGLGSISQKKWSKNDDLICIPKEMVNPSGPLYTRERKFDNLQTYLHGCEEILNHIFDLTYSIAPDSVINETILKPLGFNDSGPFESTGREISQRYSWKGNVTQQDGFFVSSKSAVGVELKLKSTSSPDQIAKYVKILALEEMYQGSPLQLGLLFIVPESSIKNHWAKCGLSSQFIDRTFLESEGNKESSKKILDLSDSQRYEHIASVLDRLQLNVISWDDLKKSLLKIQRTLDQNLPGDQTLSKLIRGFIHQLEKHRGTGLHS